MKIITAFAVGLALVGALPAAPAQAQVNRSYVSPTGNDANNCMFATPCRTLQGAYNKTNAGGDMLILGPAGYGTLTINHAISVVNDYVGVAGILVPSGGTGITITAGTTDAVSLRGLVIDGSGAGATGIQFNSGASLTITNCIIRHVTIDGIDFFPNATSNLSVSNSLVADNGATAIYVTPSGSGTVKAVFNRVEASNNSVAGIYVDGSNSTGTINATVVESVAAHNANVGFYVFSASGHAVTTLTLFHSVSANNASANNAYGIGAQNTGAILRLAQSEVTGNSTGGWYASNGGVIQSYGDNYIDGNGSNTGSLTPVARQ